MTTRLHTHPNCRPGTRRLLRVLVLLLLYGWTTAQAQQVPEEAEIRQDIRDFQEFFQSRFPGVSLEDFRHGVNALPQNTRQSMIHDLLSAAPPYDDDIDAGRRAWQAPMPGGLSLADCFTGKPPPTAYPYFYNGRVHTISGDINLCRSRNGAAPLDALSPEMARLVAAFKAPWRGLPMDVDYREAEVRRLYAVGRQAFWAKRGQMNLSCANCHVHNAGNRLRGQVLSAALGHGAGYPAYSIRWRIGGEAMGTLQRRYARCNALAGAAPLAADSETYLALELYKAILNQGVPLEAPSLRP
jgi:sulfur-oxidizing protein SoxA